MTAEQATGAGRRTGRRQVADELRRQIASGELRPGAQLPTQKLLCDRFHASRSTVRGALELLEEEGLILRGRQGTSRTVADPHGGTAEERDERQRLYSPKSAVIELTEQVRDAFRAPEVTLDAYCLDSEMLHHAVKSAAAELSRMQVRGASGGTWIDRVAVRVLLPNPKDPLALPRVKADGSDERPRQRLERTASWYYESMQESLHMLKQQGIAAEVDVHAKAVAITPTQQVYLLNGQCALTGFYHVLPRTLEFRGEALEILDVLGLDGTLLRHKPADLPAQDRSRRFVEAYIKEAQTWFGNLWEIAVDWPPESGTAGVQ